MLCVQERPDNSVIGIQSGLLDCIYVSNCAIANVLVGYSAESARSFVTVVGFRFCSIYRIVCVLYLRTAVVSR